MKLPAPTLQQRASGRPGRPLLQLQHKAPDLLRWYLPESVANINALGLLPAPGYEEPDDTEDNNTRHESVGNRTGQPQLGQNQEGDHHRPAGNSTQYAYYRHQWRSKQFIFRPR